MTSQPLKRLFEKNGAARSTPRSTSVLLSLAGPLHWLLYCLLVHHELVWNDWGVFAGLILGGLFFAILTLLGICRDLGWSRGNVFVFIAASSLSLVDLYVLSHSLLWGGLALCSSIACLYESISGGFGVERKSTAVVMTHSHQRGVLVAALVGVICRDGYRVSLGASGDIILFALIGAAFTLGTWLDWRRPLFEASTQKLLWLVRGIVLVFVLSGEREAFIGVLILPDLWSAWLVLWQGRLGEYVREDSFRNPPLLILLGFGSLIFLGSLLLSLPLSSRVGESMGFMAAVFTSTSAICVTGLSVLDVGRELSFSGQVILLALIQLGGLGIITLSVFVAVVVGAKMGLQQTWAFADLSEQLSPKSMRRLVKEIVFVTLCAEGLGALALMAARLGHVGHWGEALWFGVFHGISAFCNAGFSLQADSLMSFRHDPAILVPISILIVLGGLGFVPLSVLASRLFRRRRSLNLHTQVALIGTSVALVGGAVAFWALQLGGTGGPTSAGDALFWSVTLRTAGFNSIPVDSLTSASVLLSMALMLVGGCPGGTSGGLKVTTVALLFFAVRGLLRDEYDIQVFSRTVPRRTVIRALVVVVLSVGFVFLGFLLLLATQPHLSFESLGFEAVSAFATVGLSLGATTRLDSVGAWVIILLMFIGRVGPLALAYGIGQSKKLPWKGATEEIYVG